MCVLPLTGLPLLLTSCCWRKVGSTGSTLHGFVAEAHGCALALEDFKVCVTSVLDSDYSFVLLVLSSLIEDKVRLALWLADSCWH